MIKKFLSLLGGKSTPRKEKPILIIVQREAMAKRWQREVDPERKRVVFMSDDKPEQLQGLRFDIVLSVDTNINKYVTRRRRKFLQEVCLRCNKLFEIY